MEPLDVLVRWLHVGTAIVLLGGAAFQRLALHPVLAALSDEERQRIRPSVIGRWRPVLLTGIGLLLLTGFYTWFLGPPRAPSFRKSYEMLVGTHFLIALAIFFVASALVGRSPRLESWRQNAGWSLTLLLVLGAVAVGLTSYVKVAGQKAWRQAAESSAPPTAAGALSLPPRSPSGG